MTTVVDYAWEHPGGAAIAADGHSGAMRYVSNDPSKDLSAGERDDLHGNGLLVGLIWETTTTRSTAGYAAGAFDGDRARTKADALGFPADRPMYAATDSDQSWANVRDYYYGFASTSGSRPVGVYGSYRLVEGAAGDGFEWLWQCGAWSGNGSGSGGSILDGRINVPLSAHATLYQYRNVTVFNGADLNEGVAADWGGWNPNVVIAPPSRPFQENSMTKIVNPVTDGARGEFIVLHPDGIIRNSWQSDPKSTYSAWGEPVPGGQPFTAVACEATVVGDTVWITAVSAPWGVLMTTFRAPGKPWAQWVGLNDLITYFNSLA